MIQITETLMEVSLVAQRFDVPEQTVVGWIEAGLEHEQWNGRMLTTIGAIERFLQNLERSAVVDEAPGDAAGRKRVA
jgi:hypothetical protein